VLLGREMAQLKVFLVLIQFLAPLHLLVEAVEILLV
jgi:hypothetical protein